MLRRLGIAVVFLLLLVAGATPVAAAPPPANCVIDVITGKCTVGAPGESPGPGDDGGSDSGGDDGGGAPRKCATDDGTEVPCSGQYGSWSNFYDCYLRPSDPQPPKDDPIWEGHDGGTVYQCAGADGSVGVRAFVWLAQAPPAAVVVDPAELARGALARMGLRAIDIGITPQPGGDRMGYVGLPAYLWVVNPDGQSFGPQEASASAGGVTVTLTAKVTRIEWNMGDGGRVTCAGPGTPYVDAFGARPSPTCGYRYLTSSAGRPGDAFHVTATSFWDVDWTSGAASGTIPLQLTRETDVAIGEVQVLVTS